MGGKDVFKLSIIVPIFNGEEYLHRCIDSILTQQYGEFELILIDDGSTDNSLSICNEYAEKDSRIVVYHKENEGLVAARKTGVSLAKGEYIGFVDCDDFIDSNMYHDLMSIVERDNSDIVTGGVTNDYISYVKNVFNCIDEGFYDEEAIKNEIVPRMLMCPEFLKYGIIPGVVTKVFKRSLLEKALPNVADNLTVGEDVAITSYSLMNAKSLSIIKSCGYHYIQTENSIIRSFNPKRFEKMLDLYLCVSKIENESYQKQVSLYMCFLIFSALTDCVKKSGYSKKEAKKIIKNILENDISVKVLNEADISALSLKDKIKILLMKHNLISLLILLIEVVL